MRFTEAVAREAHDHGPDFIHHGNRGAVRHGTPVELRPVILELPLLVLFADDLTKLVRVIQ